MTFPLFKATIHPLFSCGSYLHTDLHTYEQRVYRGDSLLKFLAFFLATTSNLLWSFLYDAEIKTGT